MQATFYKRMSGTSESEISLRLNKPLRLASGEDVTLVTQASDWITDFSCRDVRIYAGANFHNKEFTDNAIAAYKSVYKGLPWNDPGDTENSALLEHEIYNGRSHGLWCEAGPSALKDFATRSDKSNISHDFVEYEFHEEVHPIRVSVIELCNPGSIVGIWAKDSEDQWQRLWSGPPQHLPDEQRVFTPPLRFSDFKTRILRLELDHSVLDYCALISGVFLIGTTELITPKKQFEDRSLGSFLKKLRDQEIDSYDSCNLTPNIFPESLNDDLLKFEKVLLENCTLCTSQTSWELREEESSSGIYKDAATRRDDFVNNRFDSFERLPDELILIILEHLDLRSLCNCARVNNRFKCLLQDALLYTSLNLKPYWNCVNDVALKTLSSCCKQLRHLDISWCGGDETITPGNFNNFLDIAGNQLTHLRLYCCRFVDDSVMEKISTICTNLRELCLCNSDVTDSGYQSIEKFECLERLVLYRPNIEDSTLCSIIRKNGKMRHLNLSELLWSDLDNVAIVIAASCPGLESIVCCQTSISTVGIRALTRCTNLREVDFGYCRNILRRYAVPNTMDSLKTLFRHCDKLEKVVLTGMTYLTDQVLEPLLMAPIRQLHVAGAKWLTPQMCIRFFWLCPGLRVIDLNRCHEINGTLVTKWRKIHPNISIKWSDNGRLCTSMFL